MTNFNLVKDAVRAVLSTNEKARNSDWELIKEVMKFYKNTDNISFNDFCEKAMTEGDVPTFETIRRWRQKLQSDYPTLRGCERIQNFRKEKEKEMRKELGYES